MKNFDDLFREELAGHSEIPPPRVWEAVEKRLNNGAAGKSFASKWMWYFAAMSLVVTVGAFYVSNTNFNNSKVPPATAMVSPEANNNTVAKPVEDEQPANDEKLNEPVKKGARRLHPNRPEAQDESTSSASATAKSKCTRNAPTIGTSVHSYDDFEETVAAAHHKHNASAGTEEHLSNGYKINTVRSKKMVAAEMVPVAGYPTPAATPAPLPKDEPLPETKTTKGNRRVGNRPRKSAAVPTKNNVIGENSPAAKNVNEQRTAEVAEQKNANTSSSKTAVAVAKEKKNKETTESVVVEPKTEQQKAETTANETAKTANTSTGNEEATIPVLPAKPTTAGTNAKAKPVVSGTVVSAKPSTAGMQPVKSTSDSDSTTQAGKTDDIATDSSTATDGDKQEKRKGLRGIFNRIKKHNDK